MDDQNQNNNPLSAVSSPPEPSVEPTATTPVEPLPIVEEPVPPAPLGSLTPEPSLGTSSIVPSLGTSPTESPVSVPSVGVDMSTPTEPQPKVVAVESDVPQTPPVFSQNTAPVGTALSPEPMTDSPMPEAKPKKKVFSAVMGVAALLLVVGVAGAAYYVSNQLSTRQAVAPTAPESKPLAVTDECQIGDTMCQVGSDGKNTGYLCNCVDTDDGNSWSCSQSSNECKNGEEPPPASAICSYPSSCTNDSDCYAGYTEKDNCYWGVVCKSGVCASPNGTGVTCGAWEWGGCGNYDCGASEEREIAKCSNGTIKRGIGTNGGQGCTTKTVCKENICPSDQRQLTKEKVVNFSKDGKVAVFSRNFAGTITLVSASGNKTVLTGTNTGSAIQLPDTFFVKAGDVLTMSVRLSNERQDAYGWQPPKSTNVCGAKNTACGGENSIGPLVTLATSKVSLAGISTNTIDSSVQCWGDMLQNDPTQDYDYNDFTLIFGYEKETTPSVGACSALQIFLKKSDGTYGSTAMTPTQLGQIKVGDQLKLQVKGSLDNLKARFRISVEGSAGEWVSGVIDENDKKMSSYSYTVNKAGTYKFEAQVSTAP